MTDPAPLSPAAQAVLDAAYEELDYVPQRYVRWAAAAALHAAADHIRTIGPWVGHIDSPGLDWAVMEIASIATELENHV